MEKEEEHGGDFQEVWWETKYHLPNRHSRFNYTILTRLQKVFLHFSNWPTVVGSSVALSLLFADFSPPAWRDQFAGASSCWTGSLHGGMWNMQSPPKESHKGELILLYLQVWKVVKVFNIRLQWKSCKLHVSTALFVKPHAGIYWFTSKLWLMSDTIGEENGWWRTKNNGVWCTGITLWFLFINMFLEFELNLCLSEE